MLIQYENLLKRYLGKRKNLPLNGFPLTRVASSTPVRSIQDHILKFTPHLNRDTSSNGCRSVLKRGGLFLTSVSHGNGEHQEFWDFAGDQVI